MYALFIAVVFGALVAGYTAQQVPKENAFAIETKAEVEATNYIAYRKAVLRYMQANPLATGTISDASLTSYFLPGYLRNPNWTNLVSGGVIYVYATAVTSSNVIDIVSKKNNESLLIGKRNSVTGKLESVNGFDTGVVLPASIPNNTLVILGN